MCYTEFDRRLEMSDAELLIEEIRTLPDDYVVVVVTVTQA